MQRLHQPQPSLSAPTPPASALPFCAHSTNLSPPFLRPLFRNVYRVTVRSNATDTGGLRNGQLRSAACLRGAWLLLLGTDTEGSFIVERAQEIAEGLAKFVNSERTETAQSGRWLPALLCVRCHTSSLHRITRCLTAKALV